MSQSQLSEDIIRNSIGRWRHEEYEACEQLEQMVRSDGWKVLNGLWIDLEESIWSRIQKETNDGQERNVYRLVGIREGFKMAVDIASRALIEREEQRKLTEKEERLKKNQNSEVMDDMDSLV